MILITQRYSLFFKEERKCDGCGTVGKPSSPVYQLGVYYENMDLCEKCRRTYELWKE